MLRTFLAFLVVVLSGVPAGWTAEESTDASANVVAALVADTSAVVPGRPFTAGLHLRMAPGWHTYWQNPGDSGLPVSITWKLPSGWKAGPLQWPLPQKHVEEIGITYGYADEVLLLTELTPPGDLPVGGPVTLEAEASWLACAKTCVPGRATVQIALPVGLTAEPAHVAQFSQARAQLPESGPPPFPLRWQPGDTETLIQMEKLPAESKLDYFPLEPATIHPELLPPHGVRLAFGQDKPAGIRGVLVLETAGVRKGWNIRYPVDPVATGATSSIPQSAASAVPSLTLPRALGFGFIGGFILNLMPCVLPVIALKIFGFLGQAGESRQRVFRTGLAFVGGIFAWFLGLAALIIAARTAGAQVTWAFQFQNPAFVLGMMLIVFVFALNLLGVFELWLPGSGKLVALSGREGYGGAFLHGMFATLLATPCTAPFLGSALAFAFTQNAPVTLAMFASIAAGMSFPYLLLTAQPGWMRFLPKPGLWMVRLKQAMGFLMLGTVVWLLGVLGAQSGVSGAVGAAWILLGIGAACWVFGTWVTPAAQGWHRLMALAAMAGLIVFGAMMAVRQSAPAAAGWEPWSLERVAALQKEKKAVFIDFTADWCLNCKYNERFVLETAPVREALRGFATLKADWTQGDPRITAELKRLGRAGVPVYVVIPAHGGAPQVLPELLTQRTVVDALERAKK
ncbi:MAG: protein-disulfide reductase DsbD family protein [Verrucomicrobia bacterium]|nr:protein-disulfide reductase DsbD family protein [Verrucomicrobiota bacterium]